MTIYSFEQAQWLATVFHRFRSSLFLLSECYPTKYFVKFKMRLSFLVLFVFTTFFNRSNADIISDKQVYLSKNSRFIKFDTKDNEVEIELGISIPVVNIPLAPEVGRQEKKESEISINAPGLVVAGVLIFTTFFIIPLLFSNKLYKDLRSSADGAEHMWENIQKRVHDFSNSSSCMENVICWTAKTSKDGKEGSIGRFLDNIFRSEWAKRLIRGTFVERAIAAGMKGLDCSNKFQKCPVMKKMSIK